MHTCTSIYTYLQTGVTANMEIAALRLAMSGMTCSALATMDFK